MSAENLKLAADLRTFVSRVTRKLRSKSTISKQLSLTERSVLIQLYDKDSLLPSELAAKEKITTQSMSQILNKLADLRFITRTPSEHDGRKVLIALSETGRALILETRHEREEWLDNAIKQTLTEQEQQQLAKLMPLLQQLADVD